MQKQNAAPAEITKDSSFPQELRARAGFYQLLAGAFVEEPGRDYLAALRVPEALASLAELGLQFDADFTDVPLSELQDALACEYATLFTCPGGCPPMESTRLAGRFQQESYHEVKAIYRCAGFELQQGRFAVFEDQLGIELSFVAVLLERWAMMLESGDMAAAGKLEKEIKRFWVLHLGRWVRGYATLLARAAEHSFYREIARLLQSFAEEEMALLGVRVDDVDGGREKVPKSEVSVLFNPDESVCDGCERGKEPNRSFA
ncbi:MAG: molecular chaperone TorD family protein [Sulfuricella sp.]|nr:molecular chaperone TorD family protein [Sulfuricella sp.]